MKIQILLHSKHRFSNELFKDLDLPHDTFPSLAAATCAMLDEASLDQSHIFGNLSFTIKLHKLKDGRYLYFFDHEKLTEFFVNNSREELAEQYNPLNELRMKTVALDYAYPESFDMFGLDLSQPRIMAVVNVTPDSFSDGGHYYDSDAAYYHANNLISEGADVLDIGGESSRPGADPVSEEEELARVIPVIERIRKDSDIIISVDTYKANVARKALEAGANWINDISGLRYDPEMEILAKTQNCPVVLMHMQGTPETMQKNPGYKNVITEILGFFQERIDHLKDRHISKIILDPGIGFGKRLEDNINIIKHLGLFKQFGYPVMIGTSRKSFIGQITGKDVNERTAGTIATQILALQNGAAVIRTHEVSAMADVLKVMDNF
jgi:dihydropteroate synthase